MDDLISRQAAIDALMVWEEESIWDEECLEHRGEPFLTAPSDVVEQLPSAQPERCEDCRNFNKARLLIPQLERPERKKGKWIEKEDDGYHGGGYTECSVCGQRYSWGGYFEANGFRYCPRCGHRMEEQE